MYIMCIINKICLQVKTNCKDYNTFFLMLSVFVVFCMIYIWVSALYLSWYWSMNCFSENLLSFQVFENFKYYLF